MSSTKVSSAKAAVAHTVKRAGKELAKGARRIQNRLPTFGRASNPNAYKQRGDISFREDVEKAFQHAGRKLAKAMRSMKPSTKGVRFARPDQVPDFNTPTKKRGIVGKVKGLPGEIRFEIENRKEKAAIKKLNKDLQTGPRTPATSGSKVSEDDLLVSLDNVEEDNTPVDTQQKPAAGHLPAGQVLKNHDPQKEYDRTTLARGIFATDLRNEIATLGVGLGFEPDVAKALSAKATAAIMDLPKMYAAYKANQRDVPLAHDEWLAIYLVTSDAYMKNSKNVGADNANASDLVSKAERLVNERAKVKLAPGATEAEWQLKLAGFKAELHPTGA